MPVCSSPTPSKSKNTYLNLKSEIVLKNISKTTVFNINSQRANLHQCLQEFGSTTVYVKLPQVMSIDYLLGLKTTTFKINKILGSGVGKKYIYTTFVVPSSSLLKALNLKIH